MKIKESYITQHWQKRFKKETDLAIILRFERFKDALDNHIKPFDMLLYSANTCFDQDFCKKHMLYSLPLSKDQQKGLSFIIDQEDNFTFYKNQEPIDKIKEKEWTKGLSKIIYPYFPLRIMLKK